MKKVFSVEIKDGEQWKPVLGEYPTKREAAHEVARMQRKSVIERRQEFTRVVGRTIPRKTVDVWVIMGNYGYGWEVENHELTYSDAKRSIQEYRENGGGSYRLKKRRVKREDFESGNF